MNEHEATDLLHRLAGDVREVPPPVDLLVAGGRAMRRHRLRKVAWGLAVAVAVLTGGAVAVSTGDEMGRDPAVTDRDEQQPPPTSAPGTRLVGLGRVVVEVPQEWVVAENGCPRDTGVVFPVRDQPERFGPAGCPEFSRDKPWVSLAVGDATSPSGVEDMTASAWSRAVDVDGLSVMQTSFHAEVSQFCRQAGRRGLMCDRLFWTPAEDTYFHVVALGPDARETVLAVRDSIQVLPAGYTTVPFIEQWTGDADAAQVLEEAGLEAGLPDVDWPHSVADTSPKPGSVVEVGSTVELIPGDG